MSFKKIIIPARAGSKGWPGKNIKLFDITAAQIPQQYRRQVIVSTDDGQIAGMCQKHGFEFHERSTASATDSADPKTAMKDVLSAGDYKSTDVIVMLYLTYPDRIWDHVSHMYNTFISSTAKSMLCKEPVATHPSLVMYDEPGNTGKQIIKHSHYQRQQYPECFEVSHYICMFRVGELSKLGKNMYNTKTQYYSIPRTIDVDSEDDYNQFISCKNPDLINNNPDIL
tara:strand:+ start:388 stop:1065 length:678 start_codon:yes stop_codon:yes gene_type:complete